MDFGSNAANNIESLSTSVPAEDATFEPIETLAGVGLGLFTLIKAGASLGFGLYLAPGSAYIILLYLLMSNSKGNTWLNRSNNRKFGLVLLIATALWGMATSHNECLLMATSLLPVSALFSGLRAAVGVGGLLILATSLISLGHGDPLGDQVQWGASAVGGVLFLLAFSRLLVRERAGRAALRREMVVSAALSAAAERHRIAADLHDGLGHHLSAALIQVEAARAVGGSAGPMGPFLARASELMRGAMAEVRSALRLHGAHSRGGGLREGLEELIRTSGEAGLPVEVCGSGLDPFDGLRGLPPVVELALWRGVQESLTNVRRHAGAERAILRVLVEDKVVNLCIEDDGGGLGGFTEGQGLRGMRERLEAVGGRLDLAPRAGGGTVVSLWVPR